MSCLLDGCWALCLFWGLGGPVGAVWGLEAQEIVRRNPKKQPEPQVRWGLGKYAQRAQTLFKVGQNGNQNRRHLHSPRNNLQWTFPIGVTNKLNPISSFSPFLLTQQTSPLSFWSKLQNIVVHMGPSWGQVGQWKYPNNNWLWSMRCWSTSNWSRFNLAWFG